MAQQVVKKKAKKATTPAKPSKANVSKQKYTLPLLGILVITCIAYLPALQNHFVWDDEQYIVNQPLLHSINLKNIFSTYVLGNYHPVTMLTYAIEYQLFGLHDKGYHFLNILLHLGNVVLVFYIIYSLSNKVVIALVASLLFGIHPLHVESVAWAAELKDLLYTFFFLSSYICYLKYVKGKMEEGSRKREAGSSRLYWYCLGLFLLALMSKAMAASLPVLLLLTDYFLKRKMNAKAWLEKIPFFILAIIFGVVAIFAQQSASAIKTEYFPFSQRIVFACYGFINYLVKLVLPLNLNAFYRYPIDSGAPMPPIYYTYLLLVLIISGLTIYSLRYSRQLFFSMAFFAITVFLVLQLLPVGGSIMADRYSYIPSIGIFYLAGEGFFKSWKLEVGNWKFKPVAIAVLALFTAFFTYQTYARCAVWKDGMTLWNDVISKSPELSIGYYNRAVLLKDQCKFQEALDDFNRTIKYNPEYVQAYNNRGIILAMNKKYEEAIKDFSKSIALEPNNPEAFMNRGVSLQNSNRLDDALKDYTKAIELKPNSPQAFYNRAVIEYNSGHKDVGCADFKKALDMGFPMAEETYPRLCH